MAPILAPGVSERDFATAIDRFRTTVGDEFVLTDDAALGAVVTALGGTGSAILALRKSEPTLEDVFVELVGRGFGDESDLATPAEPVEAA